jgi:PKD repeat protein
MKSKTIILLVISLFTSLVLAQISIANAQELIPPVAVIDNPTPIIGYEGVEILFSGSSSYDPDGVIVTYAWDLNEDGQYLGIGVTYPYDWLTEGTYYASLMVTDDDGLTDIETVEVTIIDLGPTADFTWSPELAIEGSIIIFTDLSDSAPDAITAWNWDIAGTMSTEQNPTHVFPDNGDYPVTLTVTDDDGRTAAITKTITVVNAPPSITDLELDPTIAPVDTPVSATVTYTDPGIDDTHSVDWDWGDSESETGAASTSHSYDNAGLYTVTVTVTDDDGASDTETSSEPVIVYNVDGGFVTGGGWIQGSEAKANYGLVAKYHGDELKGNFLYKEDDLRFKAKDLEWLVVSDDYAILLGSGSYNRENEYMFMAVLEDTGKDDGIGVKIWDPDSSETVYDTINDEDLFDVAEPDGGNIAIHQASDETIETTNTDTVEPVTETTEKTNNGKAYGKEKNQKK